MMRFIIAQRYRLFCGVLIILFFTALSFGQILKLSFGWDDWTNLYYIIHRTLLTYPYFADSYRLLPFFNLFGLHPAPYYAVSLLFFVGNSFLLAVFAYQITKNIQFAILTSCTFIMLYIGSDSMYYAVEGLRNNQFTSILLLSLISYRSSYPLSLTAFIIATAIFPYRAFFLLPLWIVYHRMTANKTESLTHIIRCLLPFTIAFFLVYILFPTIPAVRTNTMMGGHIHPTDFLGTPVLKTIQNFSLTWLYIFLPTENVGSAHYWIGILIFTVLAGYLYWSRSIKFLLTARISMVSLFIVLVVFTLIINQHMSTNYRYMFVIRPFAALLYSSILYYAISTQNHQRLIHFVIAGFLIIFLSLQMKEHFAYQSQVIDARGPYGKKIIATILREVPVIRNKTLIFIDAKTNELRGRAIDALQVGTLPAGASLAVHYGTTPYEQIEISDYVHCDTFRDALKTWSGQTIDLYYFYISEDGMTLEPKENAYKRCNINPANLNEVSVQ